MPGGNLFLLTEMPAKMQEVESVKINGSSAGEFIFRDEVHAQVSRQLSVSGCTIGVDEAGSVERPLGNLPAERFGLLACEAWVRAGILTADVAGATGGSFLAVVLGFVLGRDLSSLVSRRLVRLGGQHLVSGFWCVGTPEAVRASSSTPAKPACQRPKP